MTVMILDDDGNLVAAPKSDAAPVRPDAAKLAKADATFDELAELLETYGNERSALVEALPEDARAQYRARPRSQRIAARPERR
ncbi:MAG: hypothetical protein ACU0CO_11180 [Shimia sp.]